MESQQDEVDQVATVRTPLAGLTDERAALPMPQACYAFRVVLTMALNEAATKSCGEFQEALPSSC